MTIKKVVDAEAGVVQFDFGNGETRTLSLANLDSAIVRRLALHGLSQKAGDSYAGAKSAVDDGEAPSVEAYAAGAVDAVWSQLTAGTWTATREGGGAPRVTILVEAYARLKGCTIEAAQEAIGQLTEDEQKLVRKVDAIKKAMAAIKAERLMKQASATPDDSSGLAKLGL